MMVLDVECVFHEFDVHHVTAVSPGWDHNIADRCGQYSIP